MMHAVDTFILVAEVCFAISTTIIILTFWGYQTRIDKEKTSIYECGFTPFQSARNPLEVKFYLVSLLFIVFDVEVCFLFPFALHHTSLMTDQIALVVFFIGFMFLGIIYEMRLKAIDF